MTAKKSKKEARISIRLYDKQLASLEEKAESKGIGPSTLAQMYVLDGLKKEK